MFLLRPEKGILILMVSKCCMILVFVLVKSDLLLLSSLLLKKKVFNLHPKLTQKDFRFSVATVDGSDIRLIT